MNVGKNQLGIDNFDISLWIDGAIVMAQDFAIFKGTDDMDDGVTLTDIGKKFITEVEKSGANVVRSVRVVSIA